MINTILANSTGAEDCYNYSVSTLAGSNNIIETSAGLTSDCAAVTASTSDPDLGTLTGSPAYYPISSSSPALDTGDPTTCSNPPVGPLDQRGLLRSVDGNLDSVVACDIGSFEYRPAHVFNDMPVAAKEWMEPWVNEFYFNGITTGCGASPLIYCPESTVTRAAMAVFLLRAKHGATYSPPAATHTFVDMPVAGKEWMEPWVDQLFAEGITTGCGAGPMFCPEAPVTRAALAVFLLRALEGSLYVPPSGHAHVLRHAGGGQGVDGALGGRVLFPRHHHRLWRGSAHLLPGEQRDARGDGGVHRPGVQLVSIGDLSPLGA